MKFREKTYIITLVLFLLFFNCGVFSLAYYTYYNSTDAAEKLCLEESRVIAEGFNKDSKYINFSYVKNILMQNYCKRYAENKIVLSFIDPQTGDKKCGDLSENIVIPAIGHNSSQKINGTRYFVTSQLVQENKTLLVYAKDISYLDEDFIHLAKVYVATSIVASALLALCLFAILRKLSQPLEKLRTATSEIAKGNFGSRADDNGKDEFSILARDFNQMAERIEIQMEQLKSIAETKQRMLDNLAHEMRTPLTSIRGYAEYLYNANINEEDKAEALEFIVSESQRLNAIGEKLLDNAFIRENKIVTERINLPQLILNSAEKLKIKSSERNVKIETHIKDVYLNCDKVLVEILITNLADNALKACHNGGTVIIGCEQLDENAMLWVADNGIGMTKEQAKRITEPFYRTDKSRSREEGGVGLGLSLCERIVKAHGAKMEFDSEINKGTKAVVTFTNP